MCKREIIFNDYNIKVCKRMFISYKILINALHVSILYLTIGLILLIIGIVVLVKNNSIVEAVTRYDNSCSLNSICDVTVNVAEDMEGTVIILYELDNFYQNHRRYLQSQSLTQLAGDSISASVADKECTPIVYNKDLGISTSYTGKPLNPSAVASPCGLMAKSYFTDRIVSITLGSSPISFSDTNLAWPNEKGKKFKRGPDSGNTQWVDPEDEHFMVWMRPAGLPTFRKLWARVYNGLKKGKYVVRVRNLYDVKGFEGSKKIVFSTSAFYGGKNEFFAGVYLAFGILYMIIALFFIYKHKSSGGKFGAPLKLE